MKRRPSWRSRIRRWWHEVRKHKVVLTVIPDTDPRFMRRGMFCVDCVARWPR